MTLDTGFIARHDCRTMVKIPANAPAGTAQRTSAFGPLAGSAGALLISLCALFAACFALMLVQSGPALANGSAGNAHVISLESPEQIRRLTVTINKSETIRIEQPYVEALVGNAEIADVIPLTDRSLYVLGKKIGSTRLSVLDDAKRLLGIIEIEVAYDATALKSQLHKSLPGSGVNVTSANGKLLLTGFVSDAIALEKAVAIANQYAPDAVTNQLTVSGSQQVLLEVRFVEASREAARHLGVGWDLQSRQAGSFQALTNLPGTVGLGAFPSTVLPFGSMVARLLNGGLSADTIVQALEERGMARRLAEPNLVALSGDTASFLAGGEFPFPVARQDDTITIEFKKFGVGLAFTPTVLASGIINLKIEPEVSEIDPNNTLTVNDTTIPGLVTRRAKTTVELRDGQSFAIAGLLQSNHTNARRQLPWIGQVPVLGSLFRSASYEKKQTDLVIIVTPHLVRPATPQQRLVTPLDQTMPGNDIDYFAAGKDELWNTRVLDAAGEDVGLGDEGHMLDVTNYVPLEAPAPLHTGSLPGGGS